MSCGSLPDSDRVAKYCGLEKHQDGEPLEVAFQVDDDHISANWIDYFSSDVDLALDKIRATFGLQLGAMGAYPVLAVQNVKRAIAAANAIPDILHCPEGSNESHASIAWQPRLFPVDRMVALQLSQQRWFPKPARIVAAATEE